MRRRHVVLIGFVATIACEKRSPARTASPAVVAAASPTDSSPQENGGFDGDRVNVPHCCQSCTASGCDRCSEILAGGKCNAILALCDLHEGVPECFSEATELYHGCCQSCDGGLCSDCEQIAGSAWCQGTEADCHRSRGEERCTPIVPMTGAEVGEAFRDESNADSSED